MDVFRKQDKNRLPVIAAVAAGGLALFLGGFLAGSSFSPALRQPSSSQTGSRPDVIRLSRSGFRFVNPLLMGGDYSEKHEFPEYRPLEDALKAVIDKAVRAGRADKVSVYFRDLERGMWTGVNEQDSYVAASLFKVPIMIAYLQQAEKDPTVLSRKLMVTKADAAGRETQLIAPAHLLQPDREYTVEELIRSMIVDSDNAAMDVLSRNTDADAYQELLGDLGIDPPGAMAGPYRISPKKYSMLFRVLYNATYLDHDMSEKALALLSESGFRDGLVAGVPQGVAVAHKFGEAAIVDGGEYIIDGHYLSDCGIIYQPGNPYLLCVMTHGQTLDDLKLTIKDISAAVYDEVRKDPGAGRAGG